MREIIIAPIILLGLGIAAVLIYPSGFALGGSGAAQEATPAAEAPTPAATAAPVPTPTAGEAGPVPAGTGGRLTYRHGGELITVLVPEGTEVAREPFVADHDVVSPDGAWRVNVACDDVECTLTVAGSAGGTVTVAGGIFMSLAWSPDSARLAYVESVHDGGLAIEQRLMVLDPAGGEPEAVLTGPAMLMLPFVWADGEHLVAALNEGASRFVRVALDGAQEEIARAAAPADYFYPSPDGSVLAFTQDAGDGWRLFTLDLRSGAMTDYGNMGSDPIGTNPPQVSGEQKGSMYISWSPDGTRLAFGGGTEPPYVMRTVDLRSGDVAISQFLEGYAGEIVWSADSAQLAVSTYDFERTRHEVYAVDPATGEARHLMDGCLIVWSPDGRFLAAHAERLPGIAIADVASGEHGHITHDRADVPVAWE